MTPAEAVQHDNCHQVQNGVQLFWTTYAEQGIRYFVVEKVSDRGSRILTTIPARGGNQPTTTYIVSDEDPQNGLNAYRVSAYTVAGAVAGQINCSSWYQAPLENNIRLYPVPAADYLYLDILDAESTEYQILVQAGRVIDQGTVDAGQSVPRIPTADLIPGTYILKLRIENRELAIKFVR